MKYYSTRQKAPLATLAQAIMHSEAPDGGMYLPQSLPKIPGAIYNNLADMSLAEISYFVANALFSPDVPAMDVKKIGEEALNFPMPLAKVNDDIYALELFHGPTGTIKDVCARYLARLLRFFGGSNENLHVLVATNGNSGSALAKAGTEMPGVKFHVIYPKSTSKELITNIAGQNPAVQAIPVDGTIDDCRRMIYAAMNDKKLNEKAKLTSANAFNIGIVLPQIIYYFHAWAQLTRACGKGHPVFVGVPCGNAGGVLAGYMSMLMGLPISRLVAGCNINGSLHRLLTHSDTETAGARSVRTLAYAMDVTIPSNAPRFLAMCGGDTSRFAGKIDSSVVSDIEISETIAHVKDLSGYELDPHGAVAYKALADSLPSGAKGIVIASRRPGLTCGNGQALSYARLAQINGIKPIAATYPALKKIILGNEF